MGTRIISVEASRDSGLAMVVSKLMNEVASAIFNRNLQSCKFLFFFLFL